MFCLDVVRVSMVVIELVVYALFSSSIRCCLSSRFSRTTQSEAEM